MAALVEQGGGMFHWEFLGNYCWQPPADWLISWLVTSCLKIQRDVHIPGLSSVGTLWLLKIKALDLVTFFLSWRSTNKFWRKEWNVERIHGVSTFSFWGRTSNHCLAALDLGAGVEQPFGCLIVQTRQVVQSMGRSMDWTVEDEMVDGLFFYTTLTSTPQRRPYSICTSRSGNAPHRCRGG